MSMPAPDVRPSGSEPELPENTELVVEFAAKHPEVFKLIGQQIAEREQARRASYAEEGYSSRVIDLLHLYQEAYEFSVGDLVEWKPDMKNRRLPEYGQPVAVVEVLAEPERAERSPSSAYFREPIDIALGFADEEGDFVVFHFDSARFRPFKPDTGSAAAGI